MKTKLYYLFAALFLLLLTNAYSKSNTDKFLNSLTDKSDEYSVYKNKLLATTKKIVDSTFTQTWDKVELINNIKISSSYDANGNRLDSTFHRFDTAAGIWTFVSRTTWEYNANNQIINSLNQEFQDSEWADNYRANYTYDNNNNLITVILERWRDSTGWSNFNKIINTYNENNLITVQLTQNWRDGDWSDWRRLTYTYNTENLVIELLTERTGQNGWYNYFKNLFTYDANNNNIENLVLGWDVIDTVGMWVNSQKTINEFDANNRITNSLSLRYSNDEWVNSNNTSFEYDDNGNLTVTINQTYINVTWYFTNKTERTYDQNNNCTNITNYRWLNDDWAVQTYGTLNYDNNNNPLEYLETYPAIVDWLEKSREFYTYNLRGDVTERLFLSCENDEWLNDIKAVYSYGNGHNLTNILVQRWSDNAWKDYYQISYNYTNYVKTEEIRQVVPDGGTTLENFSKKIYIYSNGVVSEETYLLWQNNAWVNQLNTLYTYNKDNNVEQVLEQSRIGNDWVDATRTITMWKNNKEMYGQSVEEWKDGVWSYTQMYSYSYDKLQRMTELVIKEYNSESALENRLRIAYTYDQSDNLTEELRQQWIDATWINESQIFYYYSIMTDVDEKTLSDNIQINNFPNPFSNNTNIELNLSNASNVSLTLFNNLGSKIADLANDFMQAGSYNYKFNGTCLPSGVYYLRFQSGRTIKTYPLILKK